jgi:hypothetical protein
MRKIVGSILLVLVALAASSSFIFADSREDVKEFILNDQTDQNEYTTDYVCIDFAQDVVKNARLKGFEAYPFYIHEVGKEFTHAIVLFKTSDGNVYVDVTQADNWVYIDPIEYKSCSIRDGKVIQQFRIDWCMVGK